MGTFTQLGPRELADLAAAFGLPPVTELRPIAEGTINSNFEIVAGDHYFLRVNENKSEDDVAYEAELVGAFAAGGVPTPAPLLARDHRRYAALGVAPDPALAAANSNLPPTKWVSIFPWRTGHHILDITAPIARALGAALARLHLAGLGLPRRPSIYDHDHLVKRFAGFAGSPDPELAHAISVLQRELSFAHAQAAVRQAATHGVIHGDLFRDNVLWEGGEIVAVLDFEQASGGSLAYDLAVCLNDWCWTGEIRFDLVKAMLDGYQSVRPLTDADRAALLIEVRASAARFTITRITDVYLAKVDNPEKDFRAFLARVEAWDAHALGQLSSLV